MQASPLFPYWKEAYEREVKLWVQREVYDVLTDSPDGVRLTCKPVCTAKAVDGIVYKLKVRIVVREFNTTGKEHPYWSPTAECPTQRILAAYAAAGGKRVCRFDVVGAYLYALLEEPVLVRAPNWGVTELMPKGLVLRLKRAVYGMRVAAHAWNNEFDRTLMEYGWEVSTIDPALYVYRRGGIVMVATLHVDDFIVAYDDEGQFEGFRKFLTDKYDMTYEPDVKVGVGYEWIRRNDHSVVLHQRAYIDELVEKYDPPRRRTFIPTFMTKIQNELDKKPLDMAAKTTYRALVGGLQYLATRTRIDVAYAVTALAHRMQEPTMGDYKDALRVLQYLYTTREDGLRAVATNGKFVLSVYADAAWVSDKDANTWMGYTVLLNGMPIIWRALLSSAKYPSVSSAEYTAMSNGWGRAEMAKRLLQSIGVEIPVIPVYSDSKVAIANVTNGKCLEAVRHLLLRYHRVRDAYRWGEITISHVPSADQLADSLTKKLGEVAFQRCKSRLMQVKPHKE
jgi:hypothetical protein